MSGIQVAETSRPKKTPKTLDHIEIHPKLGGGHIVKHVYNGYEHDPKEVQFNEDGKAKGGEHIMNHLVKHAGIPMPDGKEEYDETPESETEEDV